MTALAGLAAALRAWLRPIIACALIGAVCGLAWGLADEPRYAATATVIVVDRGKAADALGEGVVGGSDRAATDRLLELARSEQVANLAATSLGGDVAGADLLALTDFRTSDRGGALVVRSTAGFPAYAAAAANAYAGAVVEYASSIEKRRLKRAAKRLEENIAAADPLSEDAARYQAKLDDVNTLLAAGDPLRAGREAEMPTAPESDRSAPLWALIGLLAGGALAILALGAVELRRRPVRTPGQVAALAGAEPLSLLGRRDAVTDAPEQPGSFALEPLLADRSTVLAARLGLDRGSESITVAVTSPMPAEGRTTVALGLAATAAGLGRSVLLMEADMRRPALARLLGIESGPGLADYLAGESSPREVINAIPVVGRAGADGHGSAPTFVCVTAGETSGGEAQLLSGSRFEALVGQLRRVYDLVIFDGPALLPAPEGTVLSEATDETLLVIRSGRTRRSELRAALGELSDLPLAGTVLTGAGRAGPGVRRLRARGGSGFAARDKAR